MIAGIDLSLTKTGFVVLSDDGRVLSSGVIKSKPQGKTPLDETRRIMEIAENVFSQVIFDENVPTLVIIEGLAFNVRNATALVQLAGLNYYIRILLAKRKIPFIIVAPTSLKKFITGSGKGDKDRMMMSVYKNYGFESLDNNICDAFSLSVCGLAILEKPIKKLGVPQQEVVNLLKKQYESKKESDK